MTTTQNLTAQDYDRIDQEIARDLGTCMAEASLYAAGLADRTDMGVESIEAILAGEESTAASDIVIFAVALNVPVSRLWPGEAFTAAPPGRQIRQATRVLRFARSRPCRLLGEQSKIGDGREARSEPPYVNHLDVEVAGSYPRAGGCMNPPVGSQTAPGPLTDQ